MKQGEFIIVDDPYVGPPEFTQEQVEVALKMLNDYTERRWNNRLPRNLVTVFFNPPVHRYQMGIWFTQRGFGRIQQYGKKRPVWTPGPRNKLKVKQKNYMITEATIIKVL